MNLENDLQAIRRVFIDYPKRLKAANEELSKINCEEKDLLHLLEIGKLNASQIMKISSQLVSVLRKRREVKNEVELLESIIHLRNRLRESEITDSIGKVRKIEARQTNRRCTMRVRTDLQELIANE